MNINDYYIHIILLDRIYIMISFFTSCFIPFGLLLLFFDYQILSIIYLYKDLIKSDRILLIFFLFMIKKWRYDFA